MISASSTFAAFLLFAVCYNVDAFFFQRLSKDKDSKVCYSCTTEMIYVHWRIFFPNQMNDEAPRVDGNCRSGNAGPVVACKGPCFTLNATVKDNELGELGVGIARGCSDKLVEGQINPEEVFNEKKCVMSTVPIDKLGLHHFSLQANWCYCDGDKCNQESDWFSLEEANNLQSIEHGGFHVNGESVRPVASSRRMSKKSAGQSILLSQLLMSVCFFASSLSILLV